MNPNSNLSENNSVKWIGLVCIEWDSHVLLLNSQMSYSSLLHTSYSHSHFSLYIVYTSVFVRWCGFACWLRLESLKLEYYVFSVILYLVAFSSQYKFVVCARDTNSLGVSALKIKNKFWPISLSFCLFE